MPIWPKIEKITRDATLSHFLLMFGYKLYSLYFPLFLVAKSFSLAQIGYTNFLIYLPLALFAPLVGFLNHKINPALLASFGVLGYGLHALGMIVFPNILSFYLFQVVLGISAALFFVSSRTILMSSKLENYDRAFAWYYSAPSWADAVAPAVGAFFIWRFGFSGVFALSLGLQFFTAIFCWAKLRNQARHLPDGLHFKKSGRIYRQIWGILKGPKILPFVLISFLGLILIGFNNTFFVLFLKEIGLTQNQIFIFVSVLAAVFTPVSLWAIRAVSRAKSAFNICRGSQLAGIFSLLLGGLAGLLNFYYLFFIMLGTYLGNLVASAGRSGLFSEKLKGHAEESAALDTVFPPLATALGSFFGGLVIPLLGYPLIFGLFGLVLLGAGTLGKRFAKPANLS